MSDAHEHCFMCGYPLYYGRPRGRAWAHLHWRETLRSPKRIDPVCSECMHIGWALRNCFMYLRYALGTDYRSRRNKPRNNQHQHP